jgi:hypothetical protein
MENLLPRQAGFHCLLSSVVLLFFCFAWWLAFVAQASYHDPVGLHKTSCGYRSTIGSFCLHCHSLHAWPWKCIYLLWVELEAVVFRSSGTDLVSSGCTEFGVSTHTDFFSPAVWTCTIQDNMLNVWVKMGHYISYVWNLNQRLEVQQHSRV